MTFGIYKARVNKAKSNPQNLILRTAALHLRDDASDLGPWEGLENKFSTLLGAGKISWVPLMNLWGPCLCGLEGKAKLGSAVP